MPARTDDTPEFKDQAVTFVLDEIEPDESRKHACERLGPKLSVKAVTLYNWVNLSLGADADGEPILGGRYLFPDVVRLVE